MRGLSPDDAFAPIDAANAADPNLLDWQGTSVPRSLLQGRLATEWLAQLAPDADLAVAVAARAHHLERWAIARSDYPDGRAGYLRWRTALKKHSSARLAELVPELGAPALARAAALIERRGLGTDPDTQLVEDAACLVFLETDFEALAARLDHERLVNAVVKTVAKMSPAALELSGETRMSPAARAALADALAG